MIKIGTRASPLALWQAHDVQARLHTAGLETELVPFITQGDKVLDRSLAKIGSKGVFTQELEDALLDGRITIAVHSAKDVQSTLPDGLELVAFLERENPVDVVISTDPTFRLEADGAAVVGTSSTRRRALLARHYSHLTLVEARGNLQTRLRKMQEGQMQALVLAYAGVHRLGWDGLIVQALDPLVFPPPVGQGSVAVECATTLDISLKTQLRVALDHPATRACLLAERAYLRVLEGGCSIPSFALATLEDSSLTLRAGLISLDGTQEIRVAETAPAAEAIALGEKLAAEVLARGGREMLAAIRATR